MVFENICVLVLWMKVASALEGLKWRLFLTDNRERWHFDCRIVGLMVYITGINLEPQSCFCRVRKVIFDSGFHIQPKWFSFNLWMLTAAKSSLTILMKLSAGKSKFGTILKEGMFFRTLPITFLQIFFKISINSKVIIKSRIDPDNNFLRNFKA